MSGGAEPNLDLGGLAAMINVRLSHEARIARAVGFGWLCAGAAVGCTLASIGIALAFYGFSSVISIKPAAEQTAKAFVDAVEKAKIKTTVTGTMSLAPNSELKLAPGQTVTLAEGAMVKLDPNSSVRVVGDLKMPQPSAYQLQPDIKSGDQLPFTSYTIFRSVDFGAGRVETGWNFDLSDTTRPQIQYCSYIQTIAKGAQIKDVIAVNGISRRPLGKMPVQFNFDGAVSNCAWFSGI